MFNYRTVLVTGGTGSFGKVFIETVLKKYPSVERVIVFSRDEYKQFHMSNMPQFKDNPRLRFFVGDVRDKDRLYRAFTNVDVVIHAAALKQVPSCEYNPFEAVKTNILGAQNIIDAAIDRGVKKVVALSTDKACAPANLYGATKLCSDKLFIAGNVYSGLNNTIFSIVRYGNVMGSRGSVVPYFKELIEAGAKELPITHYDMTRFFLQLESAVEMVFKALDIMQGGELFVKKAPSMKIVDLAEAMAPNLRLKEVGVRPGEKVHEVLISKEDAQHTIDCGDYYLIKPYFSLDKIYSFVPATKVDSDFEYQSGKNSSWITPVQIKQFIDKI